MKTHTRLTLRELARTEAMNRLKKLDAEADRINAERTHIRRLIGKSAGAVTGEGRKAKTIKAVAATGRKKMSATKRKEASERMSRIWAERRAAKAKTSIEQAQTPPEPEMASSAL